MDFFVVEISKNINGNYATLVTPKTGENAENDANMQFHQVMSSLWANYLAGNITHGQCMVENEDGFAVISGIVPVNVIE